MYAVEDRPPGFGDDIGVGFTGKTSCVDRDIVLLFVLNDFCDHDQWPPFCRFLVDSPKDPVLYRSYRDSCFQIGCSLIHSVATDQDCARAFAEPFCTVYAEYI